MSKKIIVAVGGSGGHLLPSQVLASEIEAEVLFAGAGLQKNPFFNRSGFAFREIISSPSLIRGSWKLVKGFLQSIKLMRDYKPEIVFGIGSWHSLPVLLAAFCCRKPMVLYAADAVPSRVIRLFAPFARWTGLSFFEAQRYIKGPSRLVAWPLRKELLTKPTREEAFAYYGLDATKKTVLIFGGSQGALKLNDLAKEAARRLKLQVIHFCGQEKEVEGLRIFYGADGIVKTFEPKMGYAWQAADLVICRSGASTLAEQLHYKVPALYVPYPFASDDHQRMNALYAEAMGAGKIVEERFLTPELLAEALQDLLQNSDRYKAAIDAYKGPKMSLAEEIMR